MRLPPLPALSWTDEEDAPHADDVGDVYFSGDGLAEKRAVFLAGCGLPEAWRNRDPFVVGELGFGAGINLLALWHLWRAHRPSSASRLHVISVEGAPMPAADAARVHARWPELVDLSADLVRSWPERARGMQRIDLPDGITLDLFIDDVASALPQMSARMDAWFLDGFAPSKNPAMWTGDVIAHVARLSAPGARLASYTVAGELRRALSSVGFSVAKVPGHGRKKERLEAVYQEGQTPTPPSPFQGEESELRPPQHLPLQGGGLQQPAARHVQRGWGSSLTAIVIGAGVAGAWATHALKRRHIAVTVLDAVHPGAGASGNALALVMPRLDATDTATARALIAAFLHARRAWESLTAGAAAALDVRRLPGSDTEAARFARLMADPPLDSSLLSPLDPDAPSAGLIHHRAVAVKPAAALPVLLAGATLRTCARAISIASAPHGASVTLASGETLSADLVIVCAGAELHALHGLALPPIAGRLGQIEQAAIDAPAHAIADGGYVAAAFGDLVFGATFEPTRPGAPETSDAARAENLATLARLAPHLDPARLKLVSRASVRATTPDRLPFAGAPPASQPADEKEKAPEQPPAPSGPGATPAIRHPVMLVGGLGARGFLWAPLLAELVVAQALGEPLPVEARIADLLDPDRFRKRAERRR